MLRRTLLLGSSIWSLLANSSAAVSIPSTGSIASQDSSTSQIIPINNIHVDSSQPPSTLSSPHTLQPRGIDPTKDFFTYPPPAGAQDDFSNDTSYAIGELVQVQWKCEWQAVDLSICQPLQGGRFGCAPLIKATLSKGYAYTVTNATNSITLNGSPFSPDLYFLQLTEPNQNNPYIWSRYFNITKAANDDAAGNSTTQTSVPTSTSTSSSTPASDSNSAANPTKTSTPSSGASINNSGPAVAVYIIGTIAAVGGVCAIAALVWFLLRRKWRGARGVAGKAGKLGITESTSTLTSPVPLQEMHAESYVHETGGGLPHEAASKEVPMELPAEVPGLAVSRYSNGSSIYEEGVHGTMDIAGVEEGQRTENGTGSLAPQDRSSEWFADAESIRTETTRSSWATDADADVERR